jgi:hypothetical protein
VDRVYGVIPTPIHYNPPVVGVFSGALLAGDTVCIDGEDFSVLNDGMNAIADFTGEFPELYPSCAVVYSDSETSRDVHIVVTKPGPPSTTEIAPTLTITYAGALAAGETLEIDGNLLTIMKAGVSDLAHFSGDFPKVGPGTNTITYTDSEGSRTVHINVRRKERSV